MQEDHIPAVIHSTAGGADSHSGSTTLQPFDVEDGVTVTTVVIVSIVLWVLVALMVTFWFCVRRRWQKLLSTMNSADKAGTKIAHAARETRKLNIPSEQ